MPASIASGLLAYVPCCLWKYRNICVLGFVVVLFLPETKGKPLPALRGIAPAGSAPARVIRRYSSRPTKTKAPRKPGRSWSKPQAAQFGTACFR
jgi:hypothetical protein